MKMQISFFGKCIGMCIGVVFLSGCARYSAQPLKVSSTTYAQQGQKKEPTVSFDYHVFNKSDCKRYLGRDVLAKGYQPIFLTFTNDTKRNLKFFKNNMSLTCASAEEVAKKVHTSTAARAIGYGVAGLVLWPLIIPAIVDGIGSSQANHKLDMDFSTKALHDQVIAPFSKISGIVFVPTKKVDQEFAILLVDAKNDKKYVLTTSKLRVKI